MRRLFLSALAAAAIAAAGCVQMEQEITLKADGAGELKFNSAVSEQTIAQIEALQKAFQDNPDAKAQGGMSFDEKSLRAAFEKQKDAGVELKSLKVESADGIRRISLEASFKDLAAAARATGGDKADSISLVKNAEGNYVLTLGADQLGNKVPEEQRPVAKAMMAGLKVALKLNLPGDIAESNATKTDGRSASWVLDITDEKIFELMEKLGKEGFRVTIKGAGLDLKEIKAEPAKPEPGGDPEPK